MKELVHGIWSLIWALIVSVIQLPVGFVYSFGYAVYMSVTLKDKWFFFRFWWRMLDGFCAAIGHIFYQIGFALDLMWNVNGEVLEDIVTAKEDTTFNQKNITVSASTGKLEIDGDLNKSGKFLSSTLSWFFGQKQHAKDAWLFTKARKELQDQYFK